MRLHFSTYAGQIFDKFWSRKWTYILLKVVKLFFVSIFKCKLDYLFQLLIGLSKHTTKTSKIRAKNVQNGVWNFKNSNTGIIWILWSKLEYNFHISCISGLFMKSAKAAPNHPALAVKRNGEWIKWNYSQYLSGKLSNYFSPK